MARRFAAFYTSDDDLEHALRADDPTQFLNSGVTLQDVGFSPSTQGTIAPGLEYTPLDSMPIVAAAYSPIDGYRYLFFPKSDNSVCYSRFPRDLKNAPQDPIFHSGVGSLPMISPLLGYAASAIADLTAFYSAREGKINVLLLMNNGDLYRLSGAPWSSDSPSWDEVPFLFQRVPGGRAITGFDGAGWGHAFIATDRQVVEVYFRPERIGMDTIWTADTSIVDISSFFTPEDGTAHVIAATSTADPNQTAIQEITFVPAQVPPSSRLLQTVPFPIQNIGAYEKPDAGRHVIMMSRTDTPNQDQLFLSWYYSGWNQLSYGQWPPLHTRY